MANTKINYKWTNNYDENEPNNGFGCETEYIVTDGVYDFEDFLADSDVIFNEENGVYFVLDEDFERTGEAYIVISTEETDEDLG